MSIALHILKQSLPGAASVAPVSSSSGGIEKLTVWWRTDLPVRLGPVKGFTVLLVLTGTALGVTTAFFAELLRLLRNFPRWSRPWLRWFCTVAEALLAKGVFIIAAAVAVVVEVVPVEDASLSWFGLADLGAWSQWSSSCSTSSCSLDRRRRSFFRRSRRRHRSAYVRPRSNAKRTFSRRSCMSFAEPGR